MNRTLTNSSSVGQWTFFVFLTSFPFPLDAAARAAIAVGKTPLTGLTTLVRGRETACRAIWNGSSGAGEATAGATSGFFSFLKEGRATLAGREAVGAALREALEVEEEGSTFDFFLAAGMEGACMDQFPVFQLAFEWERRGLTSSDIGCFAFRIWIRLAVARTARSFRGEKHPIVHQTFRQFRQFCCWMTRRKSALEIRGRKEGGTHEVQDW